MRFGVWLLLSTHRAMTLLNDGRIVRMVGVKKNAYKFKIRDEARHEFVWADDVAGVFIEAEWVRLPLWKPPSWFSRESSSLPPLPVAEHLPEVRLLESVQHLAYQNDQFVWTDDPLYVPQNPASLST